MDSGFVAMLMFLPKLKVFITEVGARAGELFPKIIEIPTLFLGIIIFSIVPNPKKATSSSLSIIEM